MGARRQVGDVIGELVLLLLGTAVAAIPAAVFLFLLIRELRRYAERGVANTASMADVSMALFCFACVGGPMLHLLGKWPGQIRWSIEALKKDGPAAPRGTQLIRDGHDGRLRCIRLPHESWFSSLLLLSMLAFPMALVAYLFSLPDWLQLVGPLALVCGLSYRAYRREQRRLSRGAYDLIVDRSARTLRLPAADRDAEPIVLPLEQAGELAVRTKELTSSEGAASMSALSLLGPDGSVRTVHVFQDPADAEQLAQILSSEAGLCIAGTSRSRE